MTPAEAVIVIKNVPNGIPKAVRSGMGKGLRAAALDAQKAFAQVGVGRSLLGGRTFGPIGPAKWKSASKSLIRSSTRLMSDGRVVGKLTAVGLAAMQERGGHTAPHTISVGAGKRALHLKGFTHPFATSVKHPGSRITAHPFLEDALRRGEAVMVSEVNKALVVMAEKIEKAA